MLRRWLEKKLRIKTIKQTSEKIECFITDLKNITDENMGIVVAMATKIRLDMIKSGILKPNILNELTYNASERLNRIKIELKLSKLIQEFDDTNQNINVIATMVWLHTVRVLTIPEIRHLGKEMWAELQRGFPFAMNAVETIRLSEITPLPPHINSQLEFIPPMLEIIQGK